MGFRLKVRDWIRDWPRTQSSSAASQSGLSVATKGGTLVGLKQPISAPRLVLLVVEDRGARVRGARSSNCVGASARGVARRNGSRREAAKRSGHMVLEFGWEVQKRKIGIEKVSEKG